MALEKMDPGLDGRLKGMVSASFFETAEALKKLPLRGGGFILGAAFLIADSIKAGGKLMLCGNGGSAADCQHMAAEFVCRLTGERERPALPALALTTDSSFLTAFCNDYCFEDVFVRQVQALGRPGDVLMGISTSGSSENIKRAVRAAKKMEVKTIALTRRGGAIGELADVAIEIDSEKTAVIQNVHLAVEHALCQIVEELIFGETPASPGGDLP